MTRETDLDRLTTLLGRCLGRIDEQAFRIQRQDEEDDDAISDVLEDEAARLQELVGELLAREQHQEACDLNRVVSAAMTTCIAELGVPITVRHTLARQLPTIDCRPNQLAYAVQRAFVLAAGRLGPGDELAVTTRRDGEQVVLEIESRGGQRDKNLGARTQTLCEFIAALGGHCRVDHDDRANLLFVLELPQHVVVDDC
jgi:hypothetical protein